MTNKELLSLELELVKKELKKPNLSFEKVLSLKDKELELKIDLELIELNLYQDGTDECLNCSA